MWYPPQKDRCPSVQKVESIAFQKTDSWRQQMEKSFDQRSSVEGSGEEIE